LLSYVDRIMIGMFEQASAIGFYSVAAKLAVPIKMAMTCVSAVFGPIIADLSNRGDMRHVASTFRTSTRWIIILILPAVFVSIAFGRQLLGIFGAEFVTGVNVLIMLVLAYAVAAGMGSVGVVLNMAGKQDVEMVNTFCMMGLNIGLNLFLIPRYGIMGAAIATGISISLVNVVKMLEVWLFFGFQPYDRTFLKPFAAAGSVLVVLLAVRQNLVPNGWLWVAPCAASIAAYFGILLWLGLEADDRIIVEAVRRKLGFMQGK